MDASNHGTAGAETRFEGYNIGSVSVKRVRLWAGGTIRADAWKHAGDPVRLVKEILGPCCDAAPAGVAVTGPQASAVLALPYLPESVCIEAALRHLGLTPDLVLSLGGETFVVYSVLDGSVRGMVSSNRCAAGSGEFLVQQFGRMDMSLEAGMEAARKGRRVKLASRCSVHCKSDATHKLNRGECTPADIAVSLIGDQAARIANLVESATWRRERIVLVGGLSRNDLLVAELRALLPGSRIDVLRESPCLEALGAAVAAKEAGPTEVPAVGAWIRERRSPSRALLPPLARFAASVSRMSRGPPIPFAPGMEFILGVDAGSTTTKAVLLDVATKALVAGSYLRTHGNPVRATSACLSQLKERLPPNVAHRVAQVAVTGSGRELVSVFLDNALSFNEILAHARAAAEANPAVDTLFELGGQDAKFVTLEGGVPVDYAMNDGCSAGTGSFLEEAASSDMHVPLEQIGPLALLASKPVAFTERCAAFINSEVRSALQQGSPRDDVLAGLVYAITDNYLSRVVGARHVGREILLQGGVALNPALAPALAARTGMKVTVPPHPEFMGCIGAAYMAADRILAGSAERLDRDLDAFGSAPMKVQGSFVCQTCDNGCNIQRIALSERTYPFGGLCAKWEMQRRPDGLRQKEGRDLVALRKELMFREFAPGAPKVPARGRMGLPLALGTHELYPFYAKLLTELGYEVVPSRFGSGSRRTFAPVCYPGEIMHAAVDDLLSQGVDFVFLPYLRELRVPPGHAHAFTCPVVQDIPGIIRAAFDANSDRILSPEIGLSARLRRNSEQEIARMAERLGVAERPARAAFAAALEHQERFEQEYRRRILRELEELDGPVVVLVGRPYAAFAPEVNLSIPRKIASRGFHVIPGDALPLDPPAHPADVWHFTQRSFAALEYARTHEDHYVCALSCFSCGPDAISHHRLRDELEGRPSCFLEIDSHTAHAGIETRIGAFLDIVEEQRLRPRCPRPAARPRRTHARVDRERGRLVVDSGAGRLRLDHGRVLHVLLADLPRIVSEMFVNLVGTLGWRCVTAPPTSYEILQKARKVCSGRECLPFLSMMGKVVAHLETRPAGEVTVFHLAEQGGPCQIGNWPDAFRRILSRLGAGDAVALWPTIHNNYLGEGERMALFLTMACVASDLMTEARSSLRCLAADPADALSTLGMLEEDLLFAGKKGPVAIDRELHRVARRLAEIPLRDRPESAPKVLLFGGINRIFVDGPVREFFEKRGILTKTSEISEFFSLLEFEWVNRPGFAHGHVRPEEQFSVATIVGDALHGSARPEWTRALRALAHCRVIELLERRWRRIMSSSGLLFSPHVPFREAAKLAQDLISWNSYTEAPCTVGRYFASIRGGAFDGYVNIGSFNCAPANSATAVINALSGRTDAPYAAIDADGTVITPGQLRQLETVVAQCRQARERRLD